MRGTNIITINGRKYDAATGMPVASTSSQPAADKPKHIPHSKGKVISDIGPRPAKHAQAAAPAKKAAPHPVKPPKASHPAQHVHKRPQRSQTLHRAALTPPAPQHNKSASTAKRSPMIQKFASSETIYSVKPAETPAESLYPAHQKAIVAADKTEPLKGSKLKEHLINNRLQHAEEKHKPEAVKKHRKTRFARFPRTSIITGMLALVLLGGYLTYLNLPSLSIRVAATRANVNASYPSYQPAGYSFTGPVAFSPGEVRINFHSNTNDYNYTLVQRSSNWDSQAVLDNYVMEETEQYATLQERGLTIYLMKHKAAWVNGGTFYVIDGDAPLSSEQIQKIASSTL